MKNKIEDLRNHLFATLEALQDADKPMALDRAKVIAEVAQVVINTAKAETDRIEATGKLTGMRFMAIDDDSAGHTARALRMVKN